jgi:hypothetical protein
MNVKGFNFWGYQASGLGCSLKYQIAKFFPPGGYNFW